MSRDFQSSQRLVVKCRDGYAVHGTRFVAETERPRDATVIVCAAMFTRERFYARFAAYLAGRGFHVVTFANRGTGVSLAAERRAWRHRLRDWGERDLPAIIGHVHAARPGDRLYVVGHSMGGQLAALSPSVHALRGIVTVAATAAWWGHWPVPDNLGILAWYSTISVLGRMVRVFPAERLGLGPDVDSALVRDWARWGRDRRYLLGPFGLRPEMAAYRGRVLAFSFTDDVHLGCHRAVEELHGHYVRADVTRRHLAPEDIGVNGIGHFGFFRQDPGHRLWDQTIEWIELDAAR